MSNNSSEIVTLKTLELFKEQLISSLGVSLGNHNAIIQRDNDKITHVSNTFVVGSNHETLITTQGLKNVFISGQGNIASSWNQTIIGTFNKPTTDTLFVIGNGTGESVRSNILEVYKNGQISLYDTAIKKSDEEKTIEVAGQIRYTDHSINSTLDWPTFLNTINNINDNSLINAATAKLLARACDNLANFDSNTISSWANSLVQTLTKNEDGELQYEGSEEDLYTKALSLKSALEIINLISLNVNPDVKSIQETINTLRSEINLLRRKVGYLISSLTVDKVSNASYKTDQESLVEYYVVGVADYALDKDTEFIIDDTIETEIQPGFNLTEEEEND